jgi:hypothetical protein
VTGTIDGAGESAADELDISGTGSTRTLTLDGSDFIDIERLQGSGDRLRGGVGNDLTWDLIRSSGGSVTLPTQSIAFDGFDTIRTNGGTNTFTADGDYAGTVRLTAQRNVWDYTAGATLTTGQVTGNGGLLVAEPAAGSGRDLTVGPSGLALSDLSGFQGVLAIGGSLDALEVPLNGTQAVTVNTDRLLINEPVETGGDLVALGAEVALDTGDITVGDSVNLVAAGPNCRACASGLSRVGNVVVDQQVEVQADRGVVIAERGVSNSSDLILAFDDGRFELAVDESRQALSQPSPVSQVTSPGLSTTTEGFIDTLGLDLVGVEINLVNPAAQIVGLQDVTTFDLSLFEEDLTLFGQVGDGIALTLAQCEQLNGCAPNVTVEELEASLAAIDERIGLLERRLDQTTDADERERTRDLIARYREQRREVQDQRQRLESFLEGPGSEEGVAETFDEEMPEPVDPETLDAMISMVENMYTRASFLESLVANPDKREELAESAGIAMSEERLKTIIDQTLKAIDYVEGVIERLSQGDDIATVEEVRQRLQQDLGIDPPEAANEESGAPAEGGDDGVGNSNDDERAGAV